MLALYDDARARQFAPFALTRPVGELRAGAELIRRRWEVALGTTCAGHLAAPHLAGFDEPWAPPVLGDTELPAGTIVTLSRFCPTLEPAGDADAWTCDGEVVAVRLAAATPTARFADGAQALAGLVRAGSAAQPIRGRFLHEVWDLVGHLATMLAEDIPLLAREMMASGAPS
ncbi:MAG: hypothetical protein HY275_06050, partial [Gemmatimonadetes bacterium]|nr:hypothetical protein [Gemmatimonadota bacterium]